MAADDHGLAAAESNVKDRTMGDHTNHQAGTMSECRSCAALAYEPGWYASLLSFSTGRDGVRLEGSRS
jgi:hypothetical protein